jgi:hypothetical protein
MGDDPEEDMGPAVDLYVMGAEMRSVPGRIVRQEGHELTIALRSGTLDEGEAVCLQPVRDGPWLYGRVDRRGEKDKHRVIHVDVQRTPDQREYPRVWGPLKLRYQVVPAHQIELAGRRWLKTGAALEPRWLRPALFMDFSGSGARFDIPDPKCDADDRLLIGVKVPGDNTEHRFVARVVRHLPEQNQLAVQFLDGTEDAFNAIVEFADRIQEQQLAALGESEET